MKKLGISEKERKREREREREGGEKEILRKSQNREKYRNPCYKSPK